MTDSVASEHVGVVSLIGARDTNEDAYLLRDGLRVPGAALAHLAIADGMGGHHGGEVASRMAVEAAGEAIHDGLADPDSLQRIFLDVDQQIRAHAETTTDARSMGTTLTVAVVGQDEAIIGHVGDSRAWLLHNKELQQITADHSRVGRLVRAGAISEQDAIGHPEANVLEQALGAGDRPQIDVYRAGVGPGDVLLLSTDGLHGTIAREEIETVLLEGVPMQQACERLAALALRRGSSDNVTVLAWQYPIVVPRADSATRWRGPTRALADSASERAPVKEPARQPSRLPITSRRFRLPDRRWQLLGACLLAGYLVGLFLGFRR